MLEQETSKEVGMTVQISQLAPDLEVEAYVRAEPSPRKMRLSELRGRWVVLFFYPRDFTFVCPTEIEAFARLHEQFEKERAVVIGASGVALVRWTP